MNEPETIPYIESSGNVFADLGLPEPELRLAKAMIAIEIERVIQERGLTFEEAGRLMDTEPFTVSAIVRGSLSDLTMDRLFQLLNLLGRDVRIMVTGKAPSAERGILEVVASR